MRLVRGIPGQGVPASGEAAAVQDDHHDEQGTDSTHDEYKKVTRFFSVYFVVITLILLWNLFHCTTTSWVTRDAVSLSETVKSGTVESGNDWSETGEPGTGEPETGESETGGAGTVQSETEKETIELLDGQSLILRTVDQDEETVSRDFGSCGAHSLLRGLKDIDPVNFFGADLAEADIQCMFHDLFINLLATAFTQFFAVVDP